MDDVQSDTGGECEIDPHDDLWDKFQDLKDGDALRSIACNDGTVRYLENGFSGVQKVCEKEEEEILELLKLHENPGDLAEFIQTLFMTGDLNDLCNGPSESHHSGSRDEIVERIIEVQERVDELKYLSEREDRPLKRPRTEDSEVQNDTLESLASLYLELEATVKQVEIEARENLKKTLLCVPASMADLQESLLLFWPDKGDDVRGAVEWLKDKILQEYGHHPTDE